MKSLYAKPVRQLMKEEMIKGLRISRDKVFSKKEVLAWFNENYPKIKDATIAAHLIRLSVNAPSRVHYSAKKEDDVFFQLDSSRFRLYDPQNDSSPIHRENMLSAPETEIEDQEKEPSREFAYEKDLQNFLVNNLHVIEPGLRLYEDEDINGVEFPVGGRFVDILAIDGQGDFVVVELKVSKGYDRVIGQILRYMAWIKRNHAEEGQKVRGIIIARDISDDLCLACSELPGIQLFEYRLSVELKKIL